MYTCISTIFCSRTVILQLLVVQVVWFLLQFLCLRCIARSAYVFIGLLKFVDTSAGNFYLFRIQIVLLNRKQMALSTNKCLISAEKNNFRKNHEIQRGCSVVVSGYLK